MAQEKIAKVWTVISDFNPVILKQNGNDKKIYNGDEKVDLGDVTQKMGFGGSNEVESLEGAVLENF